MSSCVLSRSAGTCCAQSQVGVLVGTEPSGCARIRAGGGFPPGRAGAARGLCFPSSSGSQAGTTPMGLGSPCAVPEGGRRCALAALGSSQCTRAACPSLAQRVLRLPCTSLGLRGKGCWVQGVALRKSPARLAFSLLPKPGSRAQMSAAECAGIPVGFPFAAWVGSASAAVFPSAGVWATSYPCWLGGAAVPDPGPSSAAEGRLAASPKPPHAQPALNGQGGWKGKLLGSAATPSPPHPRGDLSWAASGQWSRCRGGPAGRAVSPSSPARSFCASERRPGSARSGCQQS